MTKVSDVMCDGRKLLLFCFALALLDYVYVCMLEGDSGWVLSHKMVCYNKADEQHEEKAASTQKK